jgi:hypothetical protein
VKADCVAVQRGRREGWLTPAGLDQVCEFMKSARADSVHFTGIACRALIKQCYARQTPTDQPTKIPPTSDKGQERRIWTFRGTSVVTLNADICLRCNLLRGGPKANMDGFESLAHHGPKLERI